MSPAQLTLGTTLQYMPDGDTVVTFPANPRLDNALGSTHGGVIGMLLDTAGWFAAAAAYDTWIATVDLHVHLMAPAGGQLLTCAGHATRTGTKLAMATMSVRRADGVEIAVGRGCFSVTTIPFR